MPLREVTTHAALLADLAVRQPVRNPSRYAFQARHGLHARRIPLCFFFRAHRRLHAYIWVVLEGPTRASPTRTSMARAVRVVQRLF